MLDPAARLIYLDELRPPPGYWLDRAVVTTYSLDLMSLLMAPLSMAMLDVRRDSDGGLDPIGALEALRRTADRFVVFCQKGRISVPSQHQLLYGCLEPAVIETAVQRGGTFHSKTWLLRFVPRGDKRPCALSFSVPFPKSDVRPVVGYRADARRRTGGATERIQPESPTEPVYPCPPRHGNRAAVAQSAGARKPVG